MQDLKWVVCVTFSFERFIMLGDNIYMNVYSSKYLKTMSGFLVFSWCSMCALSNLFIYLFICLFIYLFIYLYT